MGIIWFSNYRKCPFRLQLHDFKVGILLKTLLPIPTCQIICFKWFFKVPRCLSAVNLKDGFDCLISRLGTRVGSRNCMWLRYRILSVCGAYFHTRGAAFALNIHTRARAPSGARETHTLPIEYSSKGRSAKITQDFTRHRVGFIKQICPCVTRWWMHEGSRDQYT